MTANASELSYVVQQGDTLSTILYRITDNRIYGRKGALVRLLLLNPGIQDPHLIQPGTVIRLVPQDSSDARAVQADFAPELIVIREPASSAAVATSPLSAVAPAQASASTAIAVIEPAPAPAACTREPATEPEGGDATSRYSLIEAAPVLYFSRIDGTDPSNGSQAILLSNANVGVSLRWRQILSPGFHSYVETGVRREDYQKPASSTDGQLANASQTLYRVGAGAEQEISERLSLAGSLSLSQQAFYRGLLTAGGGVELLSVTTPRLDAGANYRLWQGRPFRADLEARGILLLPAKATGFSTKLGQGYSGKLALSQDFESWAMRAGLFYEYSSQNTSILNINRSESGLELGLTWRIGSERKAQ